MLRSIAIRTCNTDAMRRFYAEAFGFEFRAVDLGPFTAWFGQGQDLTLKLVPIRDAADFDEFPIHQLGFVVSDIGGAVRLAESCGGRLQDPPAQADQELQASVRDPDGNTIELYQRL